MKKPTSTFDQLMSDPERKKRYQKGYAKFVASEIALEKQTEKCKFKILCTKM